MANYGFIFHLTRGASGAFDPNNWKGKNRGKFSSMYYHNINRHPRMMQLLIKGHGMTHCHMNNNYPAFLTRGTQMTDAQCSGHCRDIRDLYDDIIGSLVEGTDSDDGTPIYKDYELPEILVNPDKSTLPSWKFKKCKTMRDAYNNNADKNPELKSKELNTQEDVDEKWTIDIVEHLATFSKTLDDHGVPPAGAGAAGAAKKVSSYDVTRLGLESAVAFARLSVLLSITRRVTDYFSNTESPMFKTIPDKVDGEDIDDNKKLKMLRSLLQPQPDRAEVLTAGSCIAHKLVARTDPRGVPEHEYTFYFLFLEKSLKSLKAKTKIPNVLTVANDGTVDPIATALELIRNIRNNPLYGLLKPCCDNQLDFDKNVCGYKHKQTKQMKKDNILPTSFYIKHLGSYDSGSTPPDYSW